MWDTTGESDLQDADRLGNIAYAVLPFLFLPGGTKHTERGFAIMEQWNNFVPGAWQEKIDVRDFIQKNYKKLTSCKVKNAPRGCAKTHSLFLYKRQEKDIRTAGVKRRCVCKKEIMGKCQRDYEKTVMVCG